MKTKYVDCNGHQISYGDILKFPFLEKEPKKEFEPPKPFGMIVKFDDGDWLYYSLEDEFRPISDCQKGDDAEKNIISGVEIFAPREIYETTLKMGIKNKPFRIV